MTGVVIRKGERHTERRRPCDNRGTDRIDTATSQGLPATTRSLEARKDSTQSLRGSTAPLTP